MQIKNKTLLLIIALHFGFSQLTGAAEFKTGERVTIAAEDTLKSDLYGAGRVIQMLGTARRDLVVAGQRIEMEGLVAENFYAAGQTITIDGTVRGDILAFAAEVELNGVAESGMRAAAGAIIVKGTVHGDLVISGGQLTIAPNAVVDGDIIIAGGKIEVAGTVRGNLTGAADHLILAGTVDKDADLAIGETLDLQSGARVGGNLTYRRKQPLELKNTEVVAGEIIFKEVKPEKGAVWFRWIMRMGLWLATVIVGLVMIALAKRPVQNALDHTLQRPLATLGYGALALVATPIAVVIACVLVLPIPLGIILLVSFIISAYLGLILLGTLLGREILRLTAGPPFSLYLAMLVGVTLLYALTFIPRAGGWIELVALIGGLGMMALGIYKALTKVPAQAGDEAKP
jgi:cytoskeletal protein CcmA (bactofilin family)